MKIFVNLKIKPVTDRRSQNLTPAELVWTEEGTPYSSQFDDIYFSKKNGVEETEYVFLLQNELQQKLQQREHTPGGLSIGETGFGTGLNFLCAWRLRDQVAPSCQLNFVSVEKHPLIDGDMSRALSVWPDLKPYAELMLKHYPLLAGGWHRVRLNREKIELSLYFGDAVSGYSDYQGKIDSWFLDGFAPAKNAPMWSPSLFKEISRLSVIDTSFSTFTAAAQVREGMKGVGFNVERVTGFANKRHMLRGKLEKPDGQCIQEEYPMPWFAPPRRVNKQSNSAIVIGAGLAGTSAASSLAARGWQVSVLEKNNCIADGASGNRQGVLYCKLSANPSLSSDFYRAGYLYTSQQLPQLLTEQQRGVYWHKPGILQLAYDQQEADRQSRFIEHNPQPSELVYPVNAKQASEIAGSDLLYGGLYYPDGYWVTPSALCEAQIRHDNIRVRCKTRVQRIERTSHGWMLFNEKDDLIATAAIVIIANARDALSFDQTRHLPLKVIRGQTTSVPAPSADHKQLRTVLCGKGYIGPPIHGQYHLGATYNPDHSSPNCTINDHLVNLENINRIAPSVANQLAFDRLDVETLTGRVGFRTTTPDYLPLVGPVPDYTAYIRDYAPLRKDARSTLNRPARYLPGLYITTGHGSKGLTSAPLSGELIASYIGQTPAPIGTRLANALHPGRFLIRDLIRNKI